MTLDGGGMSDTLKCEDAHLRRPVVVKSLKPGIDKNKLLDELSALAAIRSKFVVELFDAIHDGTEVVGFVEEFIEGEELKPFDNSIDSSVMLRLLYGISSGIAEVHSHDRVHRDIKPENIRLDINGVPKLIDFGLAKLITNAKTTQLYFTPCYSPPESFVQDSGGKFTFTKAVDVYAFGILAYWLLNHGTLPSQLAKIPPSLPCLDFGVFAARIPVEIQTAFNRSVAISPKDRPTAVEIRDLIGQRLLFNQHRMLLTHNGKPYHLNNNKKQVKLSHHSNSVEIRYDGLTFKVVSVTGYVFRNNTPLVVVHEMQGASVIVLGDPAFRASRLSITADISYPEVLF